MNPILSATGITVEFPGRRQGLAGKQSFRALDGVDLHVGTGETVGLVGESGSGKSTMTRVILGLQRTIAGTLTIDGTSVPLNGRKFPQALRRTVQVVFQDPFTSLNPSMTIEALVGEGLSLHLGLKGSVRTQRVEELLESVRLPRTFASRRPSELSGGQRQRVALARAIAVEPKLLLLDEPVSSLDATTRREIVALLADLRSRSDVAFLFVGHDLGLISEISDRTVVLYRGKVMESGPSSTLWVSPKHPYTDDLMAAVPVADPALQLQRRQQRAERITNVNAATVTSNGCVYAPRCRIAAELCHQSAPQLVAAGSAQVACHQPLN
jgi:oligopeptide/dipeptide ABC transporter ATP-binding protein